MASGVSLQPVEGGEIADRVVGIAGVEGDRRGIDAFAEAQPGDLVHHGAVPLGELERRDGGIDFEGGVLLQLVGDEADPAPPPPGLAVGDALHVRAEPAAQRAEHGLRILQRNAAHHMHDRTGIGHRRLSPAVGALVARLARYRQRNKRDVARADLTGFA